MAAPFRLKTALGDNVLLVHACSAREDLSDLGETTLTLPLRFGWFGVGSAMRAALGYGDLPYTMKGQATLKLPGGAHTVVSFTHEGRAPLSRSAEST